MSANVVVVGGGPNGLTAAVALAREGFRVVVLEATDRVGGPSAGAEFHPGYQHAGSSPLSAPPRPFVRTAAELDRHGLALRPALAPAVPGAGPAAPFSPLPAVVRSVVEAFLDTPVPAVGAEAPWLPLVQRAFAARRLGADVLTELLRVGVLAAEDWLAEFEPDPRHRAALALPSLLGAFMGPRSPHSAGLLLLDRVLGDGGEVVGGSAGVVRALVAACAAWRVELRTGAVATAIVVDGSGAKAVRLASGDEVPADFVVSAVPPRTTRALLPVGTFAPAIDDEISAIRTRVTHAVVHLAWSALPPLAGGAPPPERFVVAGDAKFVERAFDDAKHGRLPGAPALDVRIPSLSTPGLAPPGHHVATVAVFGAPGRLAGGWGPEARRTLLDRVTTALASHQPGVREALVGAEVVVGPDMEARWALPGGHAWHGERALDTVWIGRPGPRLCRHHTPVPRLFLASPAVHPGFGGPGSSGALAARAVLESR